ncbi:GNAT family N-acetyltransferase [bacterium]|nr:GNAT family N-acetyltransferase [candidate division CSSED10-310 bacterium]
MDIRLRSYEPTDADSVLALFNRVFSPQRTRDYWLWKTMLNPAGPLASTIATDDGRTVGHYGGIPVRILLDGEVCTGCQIVDSMVDPDYRNSLSKVRLFARLAEHRFDRFAADELPVAFGFPNSRVRDFGIKILKYLPVAALTKYVKPLTPLGLNSAPVTPIPKLLGRLALSVCGGIAQHRAARRGSARCHLIEIDRFPSDLNREARHMLEPYRLAVLRDAGYMGWRYFRHPVHRYICHELRDLQQRPLAWMVSRIYSEQGIQLACLTDWVTGGRDRSLNRRMSTLLCHVENHLHVEYKVDRIIAYVHGGSTWHRTFITNGFVPRRGADELLLVARRWNSHPSEAILTAPASWFATAGDCDGW